MGLALPQVVRIRSWGPYHASDAVRSALYEVVIFPVRGTCIPHASQYWKVI
jgi:hypothetical protein